MLEATQWWGRNLNPAVWLTLFFFLLKVKKMKGGTGRLPSSFPHPMIGMVDGPLC